MKLGQTYYARGRAEWRRWLERHHARAAEIWLLYPKRRGGESRIAYHDAVDEALCCGWIDSQTKPIDEDRYAGRFTPRRRKSTLSPMNRERALRLIAGGRMRAAGLRAIGDQLQTPPGAAIPPDIRAALRAEPKAWANLRRFPASYQRIRIGWIDASRGRPAEFQKRLAYFRAMTAANKQYGLVR